MFTQNTKHRVNTRICPSGLGQLLALSRVQGWISSPRLPAMMLLRPHFVQQLSALLRFPEYPYFNESCGTTPLLVPAMLLGLGGILA